MNPKNRDFLTEIVTYIYRKKNGLLPFLSILRAQIADFKAHERPGLETAWIRYENQKFHIEISEKFIKTNRMNIEDITWVTIHELGHFCLGHAQADEPLLKTYTPEFINFCQDMQVNAMMYDLNHRSKLRILKRMYGKGYRNFIKTGEQDDLIFLLMPPHKSRNRIKTELYHIPNWEQEKKEKLYHLWVDNYRRGGMPLEEIVCRLAELVDQKEFKPVYSDFGFDKAAQGPNGIEELARQVDSDRQTQQMNLSMDEIELHIDIETDRESLFRRRLNLLKHAILKVLAPHPAYATLAENDVYFKTVVPKYARKETSLMSLGINPWFFPHHFQLLEQKKEFAAVYIDFSGSARKYKRKVYQLLMNMGNQFQGPYFLFSDHLKEVSLEHIRGGQALSGGTDVNVVFNHLNHHGFRKALLITDGEFAEPSVAPHGDIYCLLYENTQSAEKLTSCGRVKEIWYLVF